MSGLEIAGFLLCVVVATCAQAVTGFALALVLLGLTALFRLAPLAEMANVANVVALASAGIALRESRKHVDMGMFRQTVSASLFGIGAGVALLAWLSANVVLALRLLLGLVVIACAVIVLVRAQPLPRRSGRSSFLGYGLVSGVLGGLFSASGPPLVFHFYRQPLSLDGIRDTLLATLAFASLTRLVMVVASGQFSGRSLLLSALAVPVAMTVSWWMKRHPPAWNREAVLKIVCALLLVTGVGLIGPALQALLG